MGTRIIGTSGFPTPQIQMDSTPAANPLVQSLVAERDRLESINAGLKKKLAAARSSLSGPMQYTEGE